MKISRKTHCFIVGAKSIGQYGGYETFIMKLLEYTQSDKQFKFHVACKDNGVGCMDVTKLHSAKMLGKNEFEYCGARVFLLHVPERLGAAQAIYYDIAALRESCFYIEENEIRNAIVYILTCRIGPFIGPYVEKLHSLGAKLYLNPDGHEWKRAKWSIFIRRYWKESERMMVKAADMVICDSVNIEEYIQSEYYKYAPKTTYIAYGSDMAGSHLADNDLKYVDWLKRHGLKDNQFYISVGRFVPENNFETMIREFMKSKSEKDFAIITTNNPRLMQKLEKKLHFSKDKRIKFVGTVYDQELLNKIRERAYGYFHGHEVGGTNPSLLEALSSTKLNLLLDVGFNREVAKDAALYWTKESDNLATLINNSDKMNTIEISLYEKKAKARIRDFYRWDFIINKYRQLFNN